jgi:transposase InsO family protein
MRLYTTVSPVQTTHLQTDNGSEFQYHFELYLQQNGITHFHTYPRCPKQNAEIERFNRTLSEAFIEQHRNLLAYDIDTFNQKLIDWLLWYNTRRPHWTLGLKPPLQYYCDQLTGVESQRLWTSTLTCRRLTTGV